MKLDNKYTYIKVCPNTGERLVADQHAYSNGVCPHCGDYQKGTFTHEKVIPGRWRRPSVFEWLRGKRKEFVTKEEEDTIMGKLRGEPRLINDGAPTQEVTKAYIDGQLSDIRKLIDGE